MNEWERKGEREGEREREREKRSRHILQLFFVNTVSLLIATAHDRLGLTVMQYYTQ